MVLNNFPVTPEMYRRREAELALLKRMEVKLHPPMAGAFEELEPAMIRWRAIELALLKGMEVKLHPLRAEGREELEPMMSIILIFWRLI
jgi:hypothetical protein